jgi:hypothetical protein
MKTSIYQQYNIQDIMNNPIKQHITTNTQYTRILRGNTNGRQPCNSFLYIIRLHS